MNSEITSSNSIIHESDNEQPNEKNNVYAQQQQQQQQSGGFVNSNQLNQIPMTPETKSASIQSGSRSEIHYPGVQNPSRIYHKKNKKKIFRIMTVMGYMFAVSLSAIVLSLYYTFLWKPDMQLQNNTNSVGELSSSKVLMLNKTSQFARNAIIDNIMQSNKIVLTTKSTFLPVNTSNNDNIGDVNHSSTSFHNGNWTTELFLQSIVNSSVAISENNTNL